MKQGLYIHTYGDVEKSDNQDWRDNVNGTFLVGEIHMPYSVLVETFGRQNAENDKYKTDAEWEIMTPAGVATIYNYKTGKNYNGKDGTAIVDITDWNIGGVSDAVIPFVLMAIYKKQAGL